MQRIENVGVSRRTLIAMLLPLPGVHVAPGCGVCLRKANYVFFICRWLLYRELIPSVAFPSLLSLRLISYK